jgi:hypothetical protein
MCFENFNGSIWNAPLVLLPIGAVVSLISFYKVKPGHHYFFDPKHNCNRLEDAGDFGPHCQRYQDLSKLAIALSAGAIAFLINTLVDEKSPTSELTQRVAKVAPIIMGYFGSAIALLIIFMLLQTLWYEEYSHSPTHSTYKAWKYALCNSLGFSGLISFLLGFGWLAVNLFA